MSGRRSPRAERPGQLCWASLVAAACCFACGSDPGEASGARVVLGTGLEAYEPIEGEPELPVIKGIQGGFHVWTSFLAYGYDTDVLHMDLVTRWDGADESIIEMPGNVRVRPVTDAAGLPALASVGWPALVYNAPCAQGQRLRIELTVRDASGREASDERTCIADVPPEDRATDCALP